MKPPILLAVPNVSEGRDSETIAAIGRALVADGGANDGGPRSDEKASSHGGGASRTAANGVRLLDTHSDADHHRTVFTLAGRPGKLADALLRGAAAAVERIDVMGK